MQREPILDFEDKYKYCRKEINKKRNNMDSNIEDIISVTYTSNGCYLKTI